MSFMKNIEVMNSEGINTNMRFASNTKVKVGDKYIIVDDNKTGLLNASSQKANIFQALENLKSKDGNDKTLSYEDVAYATSLEGQYGITQVRRDANAGIITFVCDDGTNLQFDFETDMEKKVRQNNYNNLCDAVRSGYGKWYDMKATDDQRYIEVTVKKTYLSPDASISNIMDDFAIDAQSLVEHNPHLLKNYNFNDPEQTVEGQKVAGGTKIRIPANMFTANPDGPSGFIDRLTAPQGVHYREDLVFNDLDEFLAHYLAQ